MTYRLAHLSRALYELLAATPPATRAAVGVSLSELAMRLCEVVLPQDVVTADERHAYAARLDEIYFDLNDAEDAGTTKAFAAARAASSSAYAMQGEAEDAIYEAMIAIDDMELARAHILAVLSGESPR